MTKEEQNNYRIRATLIHHKNPKQPSILKLTKNKSMTKVKNIYSNKLNKIHYIL